MTKRALSLIFALLFAAFSLAAQVSFLGNLVDADSLPTNLMALGAGVQGGSKLSGITAYCRSTGAKANFVCAESIFSGSTTANTIRTKQVVLARRGLVVAADLGGGVATGADDGTGGAFSVGGSVLYHISRLRPLRGHPNLWVGFTPRWDKRDVKEFTDSLGSVASLRSALRPFASRGQYVFFVGKSW